MAAGSEIHFFYLIFFPIGICWFTQTGVLKKSQNGCGFGNPFFNLNLMKSNGILWWSYWLKPYPNVYGSELLIIKGWSRKPVRRYPPTFWGGLLIRCWHYEEIWSDRLWRNLEEAELQRKYRRADVAQSLWAEQSRISSQRAPLESCPMQWTYAGGGVEYPCCV